MTPDPLFSALLLVGLLWLCLSLHMVWPYNALPLATKCLDLPSSHASAPRSPNRLRVSITQTPAAILTLERWLRGRPTADRVQLLRLLKTRTCRSLQGTAPVLGYSVRPLQRWWGTDTTGGIEALLQWPHRLGRPAQVRDVTWTALTAEMQAGRVAHLKGAQRYLRERWGIAYRSLNGGSRLFIQHKTKLKTGRRRHCRAHLAAQVAAKNRFGPLRA